MEKVTSFNNSYNNKVVYTDGEYGINDESECSKFIWLILKIKIKVQKREKRDTICGEIHYIYQESEKMII